MFFKPGASGTSFAAMGSMIEFSSYGSTDVGYLATPATGDGPGVVVIPEWWGLVDHIKDVCDRFANEGFVALAPDLYHGKTAHQPEEAAKVMMALDLDQASKDLSGAVDAAMARSKGRGVGVVGFCMGGGLAIMLAAQRPDAVRAVAPFYGVVPWPGQQVDYSALSGAFLGHYGGKDEAASPQVARALVKALRSAGNENAEIHIYPEADHGFFNDTRPEVFDPAASALAWSRTIEFLRSQIG
jgi:carboxymethylenebutenolidase